MLQVASQSSYDDLTATSMPSRHKVSPSIRSPHSPRLNPTGEKVRHPSQTLFRILLPITIAALPVVLLLSSIRTYQEITEQRAIYLRHRVALLTSRLEQFPDASSDSAWEVLSNDEPYLVDIVLFARDNSETDPEVSGFWSGDELYRTGFVSQDWGMVFRAYVPFHVDGELRVARIDLDAAAAEFLLVHARHNVIVASVGGIVLVLLSVYAIWAMRRTARLQVRQLEMEHLAHIGEMASVLAHEIRNPLGTIKGFAQLAVERTDDSLRSILTPVLDESRRLEALVNDLLAYGRPPAPAPKLVAWSEVSGPLAAHAKHLIGDRSVRFEMLEAPLRWRTDPLVLGQALLNLVRNAVEAIPPSEPGVVRVEAAASPHGGLTVSVTDTGTGLGDEAAARLFEPFFTTKAFGTGLGLAITRKLVSSLDGNLSLAPGEGGGTRAEIRFQRAELEEVAHAG